MVGTASPVEILWSLLAAVGILFAVLNARDRYGDLVWLREAGINGVRRLMAKAHLREELFAVGKLSLALVAGVVAMATPQATSPSRQLAATTVAVCVVSIELLIMVGSVFRFRERQKLLHDLEQLQVRQRGRRFRRPKEQLEKAKP